MSIQLNVDLDSKPSILLAIGRLYQELNTRHPPQEFLDEDRMLMDLDFAAGDPWTADRPTNLSFREDSDDWLADRPANPSFREDSHAQ